MEQVLDAPRVIEDAATCISFSPGRAGASVCRLQSLVSPIFDRDLREHNNGRCFCTGQRFEETVIGGLDGHNR